MLDFSVIIPSYNKEVLFSWMSEQHPVSDGVRIGAGAVVVKDILKSGVTVVGIPGIVL